MGFHHRSSGRSIETGRTGTLCSMAILKAPFLNGRVVSRLRVPCGKKASDHPSSSRLLHVWYLSEQESE